MRGHIAKQNNNLMGNSLRNLLLTASIGLSMPGAMAQSESFTGLSGNSYYVDYATGLVMQLNENDATIVSPQMVVESEFDPIWDKILYLANEHDITNEAFQRDKDIFQKWVNVWELQSQAYWLATSNFTEAAYTIGQHYSNIIDIIEQIFELRGLTRSGRESAPAVRNTTTFTFDISGTIADYKYAEFMVGLTREWLEDFEKEIDEFGDELQETSDELDEITFDYDLIINSHMTYIEGVYEWLEKYAEIADEELLYEVAEDIEERAYDLKLDVEYLPSDPTEYLSSWAEICLDYMKKTEESFMEAYEELIKATEKITLLRRDFAAVIFAGPQGDEAGLYYTILNDNGSLILPSSVNSDGKEYNVTGINGDIFAGMPEGFSFTDLKLIFPSTVKSISNGAFAIDGIKDIIVHSTAVPALDSDCFTTSTYTNSTLYVADELIEAYRTAPYWSNFLNILPESTSAVEAVADAKPELRIERSTLIVNAPAGTLINVYTPDGKIIFSGRSNTVELPAKGLYIVRTGNHSVKIRY